MTDREPRAWPGWLRGGVERTDLSRSITVVGRAIFGDRTGVTLWLGAVLALALTWRMGFFINDTYPIANAVANLADGRLAMDAVDFKYSLTLGTQPGLHEYDGRFYARNYGHVVAAIPVLWVLEAASMVGPPRLVLAGAWTLGLLAFGGQLARITGRPAVRQVAGVASILAFALAIAFASPLSEDQLALVALQLTTLFAAGLAAVWCYRLVDAFQDRAVALAAGVGLALATPVGFWSTIPKRHVFVTALLFASVFAFARSRQTDGIRSELALGLAYGAIGIIAWVHSFEGFFLAVALFSVDMATQPRKHKREIAVVGGLFLCSLLPMFVTNVLISGNVLKPPRLLPRVGPGGVELAPDLQSGGVGDGGTGGGDAGGGDSGTSERGGSTGGDAGPTGGGVFDWLAGPFAPIASQLAVFQPFVAEVAFIATFAVDTVVDGIETFDDGRRLWNVFVRRGLYDYPGNAVLNDFEPIDLTVLESTPIVGALVALPVAAVGKLRRTGIGTIRTTPARQTDLLVATNVVVLSIIYLPELPLHSQLTVRYLLPATALLVYCLVRLPAVARAIEAEPRYLAASYVLSVVLGTVAFVVGLAMVDPALGEAIQVHALVNLVGGAVLAAAVVGNTFAPRAIGSRAVAIALAITAGLTTPFLLLAAFEYFTYGPFAFDILDLVARQVRIL